MKLAISYDKEADVVYINFEDRRKAVGDEIEDGVFARYDPKTRELVGLTILNFAKLFGREFREIEVPEYDG